MRHQASKMGTILIQAAYQQIQNSNIHYLSQLNPQKFQNSNNFVSFQYVAFNRYRQNQIEQQNLFQRKFAAQAEQQEHDDNGEKGEEITDKDIDAYPEGVPPYVPGNLLLEYFQQIVVQDYIIRKNVTNYKQLPQILYVILSMDYPRTPMQKGGPPGLDQRITTLLPPFVALEMIAGQKPLLVRSTFNSAELGIRKGDILECKATLRNLMMWNFLHKLSTIVLPRQREFLGLSWDGVTPAEQNQLVVQFQMEDLLLFPELEAHFETFSRIGNLKVAIHTQNFTLSDLTAILPMKSMETETT
eukprot:TRINITY_DN2949_c0_g1_i6.p2 TRINITY_DN2949_c0_g1~~TRINITY_DN2949_c0_g1_i6.p2  ORF type:complete len:301 (-),score=43.40 TRINITY_DN2949_c0_g1_i6:1086-1988(-)